MLLHCYPGRSDKPDWNNIDVIDRGCLPARSSLVPFPDQESCQKAVSNHRRYLSPYMFLLNGSWQFKYFDKITLLPEKILSFKSGFDEIVVPGCWQDQNYGLRKYIGDTWPLPFTPGIVPEDQGLGFYKKVFSLPLFWNGLRKIIVFNGISQAFHLYVNKKLIGFAQQSYRQTAFDITSACHEGENEVVVLVYENAIERYIEYQPPFEAHGIFRDVYIEAASSISLFDLAINTQCNESTYSNWELLLDFNIHSYRISLDRPEIIVSLSKDGKEIVKSKSYAELVLPDNDEIPPGVKSKGKTIMNLLIENVKTWSADQPETYDLFVSVIDSKGREQVSYHQLIGFRQLSRKSNRIEINGKPLQLMTVRYRQGTECTSRSASIDKIKSDLIKIKSLGFNCIHFIDGPADTIIYDLCCLLGLFVIVESDIEIMNPFVTSLTGDKISIWQPRLENRIESMVKGGLNSCCIIGWSPGRQLSTWPLLEMLTKKIRKLDSSRLNFIPFTDSDQAKQSHPVHILTQSGLNIAMLENSLYSFLENGASNSESDVKFDPTKTPHYYSYLMSADDPSNCEVDKWMASQLNKKTTCLGAGIIQFRKIFQQNLTLSEICKPNKISCTAEGTMKRSGWHLTHENMPYLESSSISSLGWSSRLSEILKPLCIIKADQYPEKLILKNLNSFADLSNIIFNWQLHHEQNWLDNGTVHISEIKAGSKIILDIPSSETIAEPTHLNCMLSWKNMSWPHQSFRQEINATFKLAKDNFNPIYLPGNRFAAISHGALRIECDRHLILISGHRFWLIFNRINNAFESWRCGDVEFLEADANKNLCGYSWHINEHSRSGTISRQYNVIPLSLRYDCDGMSAIIESRSLLAENGGTPDYELTERHEISQSGQLKTDISIKFLNSGKTGISDIYLRLNLKNRTRQLQWYGMGPGNDNSNRPIYQIMSIHNASIEDRLESHSGCHWLFCHTEQNLGLMLQTDREFLFIAGRSDLMAETNRKNVSERNWNNVSVQIFKHLEQTEWQQQLLAADRLSVKADTVNSDISTNSEFEYLSLHKQTIIMQPMVLK